MSKSWRSAAAAAASTVLLAAAPAGAATTWTQVPSGTTADVTSIDYQSDTRAWFTTADGRIFRADGSGSFVHEETVPGAVFADIAFQPGGPVGVAVTTGGQVHRSVDGGDSWSGPVALPLTPRSCTDATATAVRRLSAVFWAGASTVYYVGGGTATQPIVLRGTEPIVTPRNVNTIPPGGVGCRVGDATEAVTDGFALPADPNQLHFITDDFGSVFASGDGLASRASPLAGMTIGTGGVPRLAVDPANASRMWVTSTNGGLTYAAPGPSRAAIRHADTGLPVGGDLYDVGYAGGTVVAVGDGGDLFTSVDGTTAFRQPAAGALALTNWRAVSVADGGRALVGGVGGALVRTANANAIPDTTPPTGAISGPTSLRAGESGAYAARVADAGGSGIDPASLAWTSPGAPGVSGATATFAFATTGTHTITLTFKDLAGNAGRATLPVVVTSAGATPPPRRPSGRRAGGGGGSGDTPPNATRPATARTGGATITTWRQIALSRGRFVPVRISARSPRRFVIEIRRAARPRTRVAMSKTSLRRGKKLVKVPLRRSVRTGKYLIVVRVYQGRRAIGKRVRTAFVIVR